MTTNNSQQSDAAKRGRYNPITVDQLLGLKETRGVDLMSSMNEESRFLAIPLLALVFFLGNLQPLVAPLSLLLLFGCLYYRMDLRMRQIASIPLAFSTFLLVLQFAVGRGFGLARAIDGLEYSQPSGWGMPFVPLFLSACLFFMPLRETATFKLVLADSFLLLASGLIPALGFLLIFYLVHYTLFIAVVIAMFIDLKNYDVKAFFSDSSVATK